MAKLFAIVAGWMLKNAVQKVLMGAGLSLVGYLAVMTAFRAAFSSLINAAYSGPANLLSLCGLCGIDYMLSVFVSAAIFIMTLNSGKLAIRKK